MFVLHKQANTDPSTLGMWLRGNFALSSDALFVLSPSMFCILSSEPRTIVGLQRQSSSHTSALLQVVS